MSRSSIQWPGQTAAPLDHFCRASMRTNASTAWRSCTRPCRKRSATGRTLLPRASRAASVARSERSGRSRSPAPESRLRARDPPARSRVRTETAAGGLGGLAGCSRVNAGW